MSANPKCLEIDETIIKNGFVAVHNGIIHDMHAQNGVDFNHSDTMQFIAQYLAPFIKKFHPMKEFGKKIIEKLIDGSKFAIMGSNTGNVMLYGDWNKDDKTGLYFSNMNWKPRVISYGYASSFLSGYYKTHQYQTTFTKDEWRAEYNKIF